MVFGDSHSLFYRFAFPSSNTISEVDKVPNEYHQNRTTFFSWLNSGREYVANVNKMMTEHENASIYIFGAHVFTQYLVGFGLDVTKVVRILDNAKAGKTFGGIKQLVSKGLIRVEKSCGDSASRGVCFRDKARHP